MRLIAFTLALISFCTTLASVVGTIGGYMPTPLFGAVLTIVGSGLTLFWLSVAGHH